MRWMPERRGYACMPSRVSRFSEYFFFKKSKKEKNHRAGLPVVYPRLFVRQSEDTAGSEFQGIDIAYTIGSVSESDYF